MEILSRKYQILNHFPTGFVPDPKYLGHKLEMGVITTKKPLKI